jgi:hypothetical protein
MSSVPVSDQTPQNPRQGYITYASIAVADFTQFEFFANMIETGAVLCITANFAADVRFGSISAAPSHGTRGCFTPQSCRASGSPSRQLRGKRRLLHHRWTHSAGVEAVEDRLNRRPVE